MRFQELGFQKYVYFPDKVWGGLGHSESLWAPGKFKPVKSFFGKQLYTLCIPNENEFQESFLQLANYIKEHGYKTPSELRALGFGASVKTLMSPETLERP